MAGPPQIILASASPRREQLLCELGWRFTVIRPDGVKEVNCGAAPHVLVIQNAQRKARAVAGQHPGALVIGADTEVVLDGEVFGKPRNLHDAMGMLTRLVGRQHEVLTGVCLIHRGFETEISFFERSRVWMRRLNAKQIRAYLRRIIPLDSASGKYDGSECWQKTHGFLSWAGAYAIQHGDIVERIEGSYSNVMGLPVERLRATLEKLGIINSIGR